MYKQASNLHINIKDFFDVYPPLIIVYSEESNKYAKLFEEPKKRGNQTKRTKIDTKLKKSIYSNRSINSGKDSLNESLKDISDINDFSGKELEQLNERDNSKIFFDI